ncbi:hypothetical protein HC723_07150 [Vibrio sp. S11_S32]|uniref:hypothetical protein n=1 Tax=Vibrio sp. S11_S32 TaxID=2720225 RepID=UPI00167FF4C7|nr:hypothetical protein [Vibrio sp. S11_S32]MBD1576218.1 hypothetical protein [Vibrio sp. S11_S32]
MKDKGKILNDLKDFYVEYLGCTDVPIKNGRDTTAERFANSFIYCTDVAPVPDSKSENKSREDDIVRLAAELLRKLNARPSEYWKDHTLFNAETNQRIINPRLQVAAIVEGSQERSEKLKIKGDKRAEMFAYVEMLWLSGGFPELKPEQLDATSLATIVLHATGQAFWNETEQTASDKKAGKWREHKSGVFVAKSDSAEYKEAVKFFKKQ